MAIRQDIGKWGEKYILNQLPGASPEAIADIRFRDLEVEVKTALPSKVNGQGAIGWQFCLYRKGHTDYRKADVVILLALEKEESPVAQWVIPVERIGNQKKICVTDPFRGKWSRYVEAV